MMVFIEIKCGPGTVASILEVLSDVPAYAPPGEGKQAA